MSRPQSRPLRLNADAEDVGRGLGALVVTVLDLLRQVLERQALRRVDAGDLSDDEIERLGQALLALENGFAELREALDMSGRDLDLPVEIADLAAAVDHATDTSDTSDADTAKCNTTEQHRP
jgi:hypothetical protein